MRLDSIVAKLALAAVVAIFIAVPLGIWAYDAVYLPSQYPDDAKIFTLYWGAKGITERRINGWNYWQQRFDKCEEITVREGDRVVLRLISGDVHHGFALPGFGFNDEAIKPGDVTVVEFVADKVDSFKFFCAIRCGPLHEAMEATLRVLPAGADLTQIEVPRNDS